MPNLTLNRPDIFTKELRLQHNASSGERWLRISSNLLPSMGFESGCRFERRTLAPAGGFEFRLGTHGSTKVYRRSYNRRTNSPSEAVIDLKVQDFINAAIPSCIERVHLTIKPGVIIGRPVAERTFHIRKAIRAHRGPLEAFVALSSGVDMACLAQAGFAPQALLEFRPREKRDTQDLSETGVLTAIANNSFRLVLNEDIFRTDFNRIAEFLRDQPPVALLSISLQCDDHSLAKARSIKEAHIQSLDTTLDMVYEGLRLIETVKPACVHVENVPGFGTSPQGQLLELKLRRWGYEVTSGVYDAPAHGGKTGRKRFYLVGSVYPGFQPPAPKATVLDAQRVWSIIEDQIPFCRDATATSSLQDGIQTGRVRLIRPESQFAPTILKSQQRHTKDSIYLAMPDGRYLFPNETILRRLQGIPDSFVLDAVGQEIAVEQIGQSIDWSMHHAFAVAIHAHLDAQRTGSQVTGLPTASMPIRGVADAPRTLVRPNQYTFQF